MRDDGEKTWGDMEKIFGFCLTTAMFGVIVMTLSV